MRKLWPTEPFGSSSVQCSALHDGLIHLNMRVYSDRIAVGAIAAVSGPELSSYIHETQ